MLGNTVNDYFRQFITSCVVDITYISFALEMDKLRKVEVIVAYRSHRLVVVLHQVPISIVTVVRRLFGRGVIMEVTQLGSSIISRISHPHQLVAAAGQVAIT